MFVQKLDIPWIRLCNKVKKNIIDVFDVVLLKIECFFQSASATPVCVDDLNRCVDIDVRCPVCSRSIATSSTLSALSTRQGLCASKCNSLAALEANTSLVEQCGSTDDRCCIQSQRASPTSSSSSSTFGWPLASSSSSSVPSVSAIGATLRISWFVILFVCFAKIIQDFETQGLAHKR